MKKVIYFYFIFKKFILIILHSLIENKGFFSTKLKFKVENHLIFDPRVKHLYDIKPEFFGKFQPERFITKDCVKLYSWYIKPQKNMPVILFCPGQSENIAKWQNTALYMLEQGYGGLFLSYRGHYKSAGMPTEEGIYTDADTAIEYLVSKGFGEENIIVWGRSLGSTVACEMALRHNLMGIIMESSISDIRSAAISLTKLYLELGNVHFLQEFLKTHLEKTHFIQGFENYKKFKNIKCPALIIHSKNDQKIPYQTAQKLHDLNPYSKLIISEDGSHDYNDWCFDEITLFIDSLCAVKKNIHN